MGKEKLRAYPTFIAQNDSIYLVYIPDMEIYTEGKTIANAIEMARDAIGLKAMDYEDDAIGLMGIDMQDDGKELPEPSSYSTAIDLAARDADVFDYSKGILTLVDVDVDEYRKKIRNRAVKKNCTIPYWLCEQAEQAGINFSKVLQEALSEKLNVKL